MMRYLLFSIFLMSTAAVVAQTTSSKSKSADKLYERGLVLEETKTKLTPLAVIPVVPGIAVSEINSERNWKIGELILFDQFKAELTDSTVQFRGMSQLDFLGRLLKNNPKMKVAVFTFPAVEEAENVEKEPGYDPTVLLSEFAERYLVRRMETMDQLTMGKASSDWAELFFQSAGANFRAPLQGKLVAMIVSVD